MLQVLFGTIMADTSDLISHVVYPTKTDDVESESNLTTDDQATVVVKLEMPDDSGLSTEHFLHNVTDFYESKNKTGSIVHERRVCDDYITHDDVRHTIESKKYV
jgi:hypothetical protein